MMNLDRSKLPTLGIPQFRETLLQRVAGGARVAGLFAHDRQLIAVLASDAEGTLEVVAGEPVESFESLTPDCPQVHLFEREIYEQSGIEPTGHPWLKPVRKRADETPMYRLEGEEVHEVAVGPVHAGVIEPGHFRFQCHGEEVFHLEIALGYQHRGIEKKLVGGPDRRTPFYMETLAGDTSVGHATAYARLVEALSGTAPPPRGECLRTVAAELERIANHIGDLGALAGDVGFLPTMSYCGRLRGDALNLTALLCGNRFGRGLVRPGGVAHDVDADRIQTLQTRLSATEEDVASSVELLFNTPSVLARFEGTGVLDADTAREIGLVGPAARACGLQTDARRQFPYDAYRWEQPAEPGVSGGDVLARARIRWQEIREGFGLVRRLLRGLPDGPARADVPDVLPPNRFCCGLVEGWRGEILHAAVTGDDGRFVHYKVVDPSFHNWFGLALALRGEGISDFPVCNKSFNLSYCGHDL